MEILFVQILALETELAAASEPVENRRDVIKMNTKMSLRGKFFSWCITKGQF